MDLPAINYEIDFVELEFDFSTTGNILGNNVNNDPYNNYIDYEILETVSLRDNVYNNVLKIVLPNEDKIINLWIAYGYGLIAFELDNELYTR